VKDDGDYRLASLGGRMATCAGGGGMTSLNSIDVGNEFQRVASVGAHKTPISCTNMLSKCIK
jgi:hypothetical protein